MADDVKIPISTPGAKDAKRDLDGVADSLHKVGDTAKRSGGEAVRETGALHDVTGKLAQGVMSLVGSYAGLQGVLKLLQGIREEHERELQVTLRHTEAQRGLLMLTQVSGERPETQKQLMQMAVAAGRPVEQVAPAYYTLKSGTAGMAPERQQGLMSAALAMGKTDFSADLNAIVNLFSTLGAQNPDLSPTQISNLAWQTVNQAKATPSEMAAYLPPILSTGGAAGIDPATLAAAFSFSTRAGGGAARSGTAVSATLMGLLRPSSESKKALEALGYPSRGGLMERVNWVAGQGESLPPELEAALGGRRGIEFVAALTRDPAGFAAEIAGSRAAMNAPGSEVARELGKLYGEAPAQRMLDQIRSIGVAADVAENDPAALERKLRLGFRDLLAKRMGAGAATRWIGRMGNEAYAGLTGSAIGQVDPVMAAMEELVVAGYEPEAVISTVLGGLGERGYSGNIGGYGTGARDYRAPAGQTEAEVFRGWLQAAGRRPMQAPAAVYQGGTHYHNENKNDPAGKPR